MTKIGKKIYEKWLGYNTFTPLSLSCLKRRETKKINLEGILRSQNFSKFWKKLHELKEVFEMYQLTLDASGRKARVKLNELIKTLGKWVSSPENRKMRRNHGIQSEYSSWFWNCWHIWLISSLKNSDQWKRNQRNLKNEGFVFKDTRFVGPVVRDRIEIIWERKRFSEIKWLT